jgi:hypothetical protein
MQRTKKWMSPEGCLVICSARRQHHTHMYFAANVDYSLRMIAFLALWLEPRRVHVVVGLRNLAGCEQVLSRRDAGLWIAQRCDRLSSYRAHAQGALDPLAADHELYPRLDVKPAEPQTGAVSRRTRLTASWIPLRVRDKWRMDARRCARQAPDRSVCASHRSPRDGRAKLQRGHYSQTKPLPKRTNRTLYRSSQRAPESREPRFQDC